MLHLPFQATSSICVPMQIMLLPVLPVQDTHSSRSPVQTMPQPFPDNWRDSVFLISTATGCSSRMDSLNGMFLLPRTDLQPELANIFCDKIGKYNQDAQMTHLSYNVAEGMWILEQRPTSLGEDEVLATFACTNRFPKYADRWHLVHNSFGDKGSINVDRWTVQDYKNRRESILTSSGKRLSNGEAGGTRFDQRFLNDEELVTSSDHRSWNVNEVSQELTVLKSIA